MRGILPWVVASVNAELDKDYALDKFRRGDRWGWWRLWYGGEPWGNKRLSYMVILQRRENPPSSWWQLAQAARDKVEGEWVAAIYLAYGSQLPQSLVNAVRLGIEGISSDSRIQKYDNWSLLLGVDELNEEFVTEFADMVTQYIKVVTPEVDQAYERGEFEDEDGEEGEGEA